MVYRAKPFYFGWLLPIIHGLFLSGWKMSVMNDEDHFPHLLVMYALALGFMLHVVTAEHFVAIRMLEPSVRCTA